jgi:hypothetical protein
MNVGPLIGSGVAFATREGIAIGDAAFPGDGATWAVEICGPRGGGLALLQAVAARPSIAMIINHLIALYSTASTQPFACVLIT